MADLFVRKPLDLIMREVGEEGAHTLRRVLGPWSLAALGVGAIIGAGIFVLTGVAAYQNSGPAVVLSFVAASLACAFAGLCYAEFASLIPIAGSAYTYGYATLGELFAWIIGWDLILEYSLAASAVSVGWAAYFVALLEHFGIRIPAALTTSTYDLGADGEMVFTGGFNLLALLVLLVISAILAAGIQESARVNAFLVALKIGIVVLFIAVGVWYVKPENWTPFIPPNTGEFGVFGWSGVIRGAALVFFAYIGFDAVSTVAQECKNPGRDVPIGMLGSLALCTLLYVLVAGVLTGLVPYTSLGVPHPISVGIAATPFAWLGVLVDLGAVLGLGSVMLVQLLGQSRIFYAMSRDGLLPPVFSEIHPRTQTPLKTTLITGVLVSIPAAMFPIGVLGHMVNIGTLLAFAIVSGSVIVLRVRQPELHRPFKVPGYPLVPVLGVLSSLGLMAFLPIETWERLAIWLVIGLLIYRFYGKSHSRVQAASGS